MSVAILLYLMMSLLAFGVSLRSYISYTRVNDKALLYFSIAFLSISIYLGTLSFLLYIQPGPLLFGKIMAIARISIFIAVIYFFRTPIFKTTIFGTSTLTCLLLFGALLVTWYRLINDYIPVISDMGIVVLNLPMWIGFLSGFPALSVALLWYYYFIKSLPENVSLSFKIKSYFLCIGGVLLGVSDITFLMATDINFSLIGSLIGVIGYIVVLISTLITDIRNYIFIKLGKKYSTKDPHTF